MLKGKLDKLGILLKNEERILVAYLFGSYARKIQTSQSDVDIAVLLSSVPENILEYYLYLTNRLAKVLESDVDLIILNAASPLLKYQVIKYGKLLYSRKEEARVTFEARAQSEYLDFSRAIARYDECLMKNILT